MEFLKLVTFSETGPTLSDGHILLKPPQMSDYAEWSRLRGESRAFLRPWEPAWTDDELSRAAFRRRLRFYARDFEEEKGYAFFLHRVHDNALVGAISISDVRRGVTQSCSIGYWIGERHARNGYMTRALRTIVGFVFDRLKLHRLEAACLPENIASVALLERMNFAREGLAREYLKIDGRWRDHLLFALLEGDRRA